jgi:hypothetical protein
VGRHLRHSQPRLHCPLHRRALREPLRQLVHPLCQERVSPCPTSSRKGSRLPPTAPRIRRWNILDLFMILFSLLALMLNTSGISVMRLIRVFRVLCIRPPVTKSALPLLPDRPFKLHRACSSQFRPKSISIHCQVFPNPRSKQLNRKVERGLGKCGRRACWASARGAPGSRRALGRRAYGSLPTSRPGLMGAYRAGAERHWREINISNRVGHPPATAPLIYSSSPSSGTTYSRAAGCGAASKIACPCAGGAGLWQVPSPTADDRGADSLRRAYAQRLLDPRHHHRHL